MSLLVVAPFARGAEPGLVFSVRTWAGEYTSRDVPGGVEAAPTEGAIYTVNADGTGLGRVVPPGPGTDHPAASPPDCKRAAFVAVKDGGPNVFVVDIDGGGRRQVTTRKTPCGRVKWGPDGKRLSVVSFEGKYPQLFAVPAEGGGARQLTRPDGGVNFAHWRPE